MAKLVTSDGIALIQMSPLERWLLGRHFLAFELSRIVGLYLEEAPKRRSLGQRRGGNLLYLVKSGEYIRGVKRILVVGSSRKQTVRILLLNPAFDEIYLQIRKPEQILELLAKEAKKPLNMGSETL